MSDRRDFFGKALGAFAGLGALGALYAAKRTWDPLPSVKAAGFTTVDLSAAQPNVLNVEKWRGKPVFILKKDKKTIATQSKDDAARDVIVGKDRYMVCIGLCTHLGCIPAYFPDEYKFKCACHGAQYDASAINIRKPAPLPMLIPPFKVEGTKIVLGEAGEQYKKMEKEGVLGHRPLHSNEKA